MADSLSIPSERKRGDALMENMENSPIPTQGRKLKDRLEYYLSFVTEYGIYLYIFLLFFDMGEGLRNIGLYGALTSWLILTFFTNRVRVSPDIVTYGFVTLLISILLSSFFSIEPIYSFNSLKRDALKAVITFFIISTFFDIRMLFRLSKVICFSGLFILTLGLYSFLSGKTEFFTSASIFLSVHYNEYGFFLGYLMPFFLIFFIQSEGWKKQLWGLSLIAEILGTVLSSSRGAIGNISIVLVIWALFLLKRTYLKKVLMATIISVLFIIVSFNFWPEPVKMHILSTSKDLKTFNQRTHLFWKPALEAVKKQPLFGWGYGGKIYRDQRPFANGEKPYWELQGGLHSTFITILFHQGIFGLLSYVFLLFSTAFILFRMSRRKGKDERKLLSLTLLSIIVGSFFVNSFLLSVPFERIAPILGMSSSLFKQRSKYENH
jgi:O-antigen ligase